MEQKELIPILRAIEDTIHGNPDAYTVIVTAFMQKLYRTARSICRSDATAEDLVQETLIDGYLHLSTLREPEKIEGWLMRILKNKALNVIIRSKRIVSDDILNTVADRRTPESLACANESLLEWRKKLNGLTPALRETAVLYFWHRMTMEEIACRTGVALGTVKRRIHDAREKLKKESNMNEQSILPDSFAEAVAKKITELEHYTKTYGAATFDSAYTNVKELISNLSDVANVKKYTLRGAEIAAQTDLQRYAEESLAIYQKYNQPRKASWLYLDLCWKLGNQKQKTDYTLNTILPALEAYPDSDERNAQIAYHMFWLASYEDMSTTEGRTKAGEWLNRAAELYKTVTSFVDAMVANTVSALKGLEQLEDGRESQICCVTGESWFVKDGNLQLHNEPGTNYGNGFLWQYQNYINMNAGSGDGWFFPHTVPCEAGQEERMVDKNGMDQGMRRVVSTTETVVTPAGTFDNCLHLERIDNVHLHIWFAKDVGIVKVDDTNPTSLKVLSSYDIKGGEGYFPMAVGNTWRYETPDKPEVLFERHEYTIEQIGKHYQGEDAVTISALNYIALEKNWQETCDDPGLLLSSVDGLCEENKYPEAAEKLRQIIVENKSRDITDQAIVTLEYLEEKLTYDKKGWRFCPSSANISTLEITPTQVLYDENGLRSFEMGGWGSRGEENRIFGAKPFRYLQNLGYALWDSKWVPGYTAEYGHSYHEGKISLKVEEGGTVETPAGSFAGTVKLTFAYYPAGNPDNYDYFFYEYTDAGIKEYWFAPEVGVVRFKSTWGKHLETDCTLTDYHTVSAPGEMMPIHIGNRWRYDEKYLTAENYIARRDYKVISGMGNRYVLADQQMFTYRGTTEEYEAFKASLNK